MRFEGLVDQERVRQLLDEAAIVVIPSIWSEGFPLIVAEAFERGRPIISTKRGPISDLVTDDTGWSADANPEALGEVLSMALFDPELPKRAIAARAAYEALLSPERVLERLLGAYSDVVIPTERSRSSSNGRHLL